VLHSSHHFREVVNNLGVFHASPLPMWLFDQRTLTFLEVNEAAIRQYGFTREEFLSRSVLDIRPVEEVGKMLTSVLRHHATDGALWKHRKKDGTVFQVKIVNREVIFEGRNAELVTAEPLPSTSAEN
jgi:PAS domain S-box-containing protein